MCRTRYLDGSEYSVSPENSETCELCNCREAYGTFNVEDVETWVCDYCAVNAIVVDGRIIMHPCQEGCVC